MNILQILKQLRDDIKEWVLDALRELYKRGKNE